MSVSSSYMSQTQDMYSSSAVESSKKAPSLSEEEPCGIGSSTDGGVTSTIVEQDRSYLSSDGRSVLQENGIYSAEHSYSEMQTCNLCGHPSPGATEHSDAYAHENEDVSCSDLEESDSGIESGRVFVSCSTSSTQSKGGTVPCTESSESDEEERIDKAILHLDVKVDRMRLRDEARELLKLIPEGYIPLPHQVAGHNHVNGKLGFLQMINHNDILYKPVNPGNKGPREVMFYEGLFDPPEETLPRDLQRLKRLIPGYYGVCDIRDRAGVTHQFIKLEDVASRFHKPCILDVKVRRRHYNESTNKDKIENEKRKYPLQEVLGFRIAGMRVYQSTTDEYLYFDKRFGRSVSIDEVLESLRAFFLDGSHKRSDAIAAISNRLYEFLDWIQTQASYKLFATSLLIIYEGDSNQPIKSPDQLVDVRWVDFAYAYDIRQDGRSQLTLDENVIYGLKTLIQFLERLK